MEQGHHQQCPEKEIHGTDYTIPFLYAIIYLSFQWSRVSFLFLNKYGYWFTFSLFEYFVIYIVIETLFNRCSTNKMEIVMMLIMLGLSVSAYYYEQLRYSYNLGIWKSILTVLSFSKIKYIIFFWLGTYVKRNFVSFVHLTDNQHVIATCLGFFLLLLIIPCATTSNECQYISYILSGLTGIVIIFTYFRKNEAIFLKTKKTGFILQYIGRRTLDIYLLHYFFLPYHMTSLGTWLSQYSNKSVDMLIMLLLALWVIAISLLVSNLIRLSPFLGHYLFGVKTNT